MWYQEGPYAAYFHSGRFQDVVDLANTTFTWAGKPVLEESYYWRGKAYLMLGEENLAMADLQKAASLNSNYAAPRQELSKPGCCASLKWFNMHWMSRNPSFSYPAPCGIMPGLDYSLSHQCTIGYPVGWSRFRCDWVSDPPAAKAVFVPTQKGLAAPQIMRIF